MTWTPEQEHIAVQDIPLAEIAKKVGKSVDAVRQHRFILRKRSGLVKPSPYPSFNKPLVVEANRALILPDCETPFHNANFLNNVIGLALAWNIETLICAGDLFHLETLSSWEPGWRSVIASYMDADTRDSLYDLFLDLPKAKREKALAILEKTEEKTDSTFAEEVREAKKFVKALNVFPNRYHIMGNHEGRLLKALNSNLEGQNLADIFQMQDWKTSEYYFCVLNSCGQEYRVSHPKPYGKNAPAEMASRFLCHYVMGHSHDWSMRKDRSGKFWAISMGHCADEAKFPYEAQRDRTYWQHTPGALIVREGYPFLLTEDSPFEALRAM